MSSLEKLSKKDLITLTRELKQENKMLRKQLDNVNNSDLDEKSLPLFAGTYYKEGSSHIVDVLKYSPDSNNVKVVQKIKETSKEIALYKLEMIIAEKLFQQVYNKGVN